MNFHKEKFKFITNFTMLLLFNSFILIALDRLIRGKAFKKAPKVLAACENQVCRQCYLVQAGWLK